MEWGRGVVAVGGLRGQRDGLERRPDECLSGQRRGSCC